MSAVAKYKFIVRGGKTLRSRLRALGLGVDTLRFIGTADWDYILADASAQFKKLMVAKHPDRGGDAREAQRLSELFSQIKALIANKRNPVLTPRFCLRKSALNDTALRSCFCGMQFVPVRIDQAYHNNQCATSKEASAFRRRQKAQLPKAA